MRDEKTIHQRLEQLRGQFLQWGTPDLQVFVITKDELRGWIRALEWILGITNAAAKGLEGCKSWARVIRRRTSVEGEPFDS
jgi:hypothetical protein